MSFEELEACDKEALARVSYFLDSDSIENESACDMNMPAVMANSKLCRCILLSNKTGDGV